MAKKKSRAIKRRAPDADAPQLGPADWVRAGWQALVEGGVAGVRVETLARRLGVTKGSFYWHFADRSALLLAMLGTWERLSTERIIELVESRGGTPRERLLQLMEVCTSSPEGDRAEAAMRAWGTTDADVAERLARIDQRRQDYVAGLLVDCGLPPETAQVRSRLLYRALIGEFTWTAHGGERAEPAFWQATCALLAGDGSR